MTRNAEDTKILERIKKLYAKAQSAQQLGSLEEADSFMQGVYKTLSKHNMEMSDLEETLHDEVDPMMMIQLLGGFEDRMMPNHERWVLLLSDYVANAHFCGRMVTINANYVIFVGRRSNVTVCAQMYKYLQDMARKLCIDAINQERSRPVEPPPNTISFAANFYEGTGGLLIPIPIKSHLEDFRLNWLESFAALVGHRYNMMRKDAEAQNDGVRLVLVGVHEEAEAAARAAAQAPEDALPPVETPSTSNYRAQQQGAQAASTVHLKPNIVDAPKGNE